MRFYLPKNQRRQENRPLVSSSAKFLTGDACMNNKKIKILNIILIVICFIMFGLQILMLDADKMTTQNTTQYTATIKSITIKNKSVPTTRIMVEEFDNDLYISNNVLKFIDSNYLKYLTNGVEISFNIDNAKINQINNVEFIDIVALRLQDKVIFSLDDYNGYIRQTIKPARIVCGIFAILAAGILVLNLVKQKRNADNGSRITQGK